MRLLGGPMVKLVDTRDLKSLGASCTGSSPVRATKSPSSYLCKSYFTHIFIELAQPFGSSRFNRTSFQQQLKRDTSLKTRTALSGFNRTSFQQQLKRLPLTWVRHSIKLQSYILSTTTETRDICLQP